jgi:hypothetical protein
MVACAEFVGLVVSSIVPPPGGYRKTTAGPGWGMGLRCLEGARTIRRPTIPQEKERCTVPAAAGLFEMTLGDTSCRVAPPGSTSSSWLDSGYVVVPRACA